MPDSSFFLENQRVDEGISIYIHIPFCARRCGYCDFNTYITDFGDGASKADFYTTIEKEIRLSAKFLEPQSPRVKTIFFGGGTPTILPAFHLASIVRTISDVFDVSELIEVTTEANPETLTRQYVHDLAVSGFTRLSCGVQSAVPSVLRTLDRQHNDVQVRNTIAWAKECGLDTSIDLIYGTPGETLDQWEQSLHMALELDPGHISAYALTIADNTKMGRLRARGEIPPVNPDVQADFYERADEIFARDGYKWYEISNWARPGKECKHNQAYWSS
ncbi:MAG: radical SAM family heme chaperone HemW, partial [Actinomycetaceae bacterium]|nr:radical SAM family heme chaperone HemW [Actinomycetaceae bacterium]